MRSSLLIVAALATPAAAQVNAGKSRPNPVRPFVATPVATFEYPWAVAFLPDARMLVTEKPGRLYLVSQTGAKTQITGVPRVNYEGQEGLLDVAPSPAFARDHAVYITYSEPGPGGSSLALARATLTGNRLAGLKVIWRQGPKGDGGQDGGIVAFDPAGTRLFLAVGERMRKTPAQDPKSALGKIVTMGLDGAGPRFVSSGHRNPYGLAFDPRGRLWDIEMGPRGGDELNLIRPGANYGWPNVSYGINYDGTPIPSHDSTTRYAKPALYWTPVIAPAGLAFYQGALFPAWKGSAFTGGLASQVLVRIAFDKADGAREVDRWDMQRRIRDVAVGPDGALWVIEDERDGRLLKLTPKR